MTTTLIQIIITLITSGILYAVCSLSKHDPTIIAGFKWGITAEEIAADKHWLKTFNKTMKLNATVTLVAGIATSFLSGPIYYVSALTVPTIVSSVYLAVTQPKGGLRM